MTCWRELQAASASQLIAWAEGEPWARRMADCAQDPEWHAEGDVWTHAQMVLDELERLDEWPSLSPRDRAMLRFVALFHDAGKAETTQVDPATGRTHSPRHSLASVEICRAALRALECDLATREEIVRLVRFHGRPAYLLEKADPAHEVISMSWQVNLRLLYLFAIADTRGRTTREFRRSEETLALWKLAAEEHDCFDHPYEFANDQARFMFYRGELSSLHYTPHDAPRCTVTMMSGLPAAGKDTWLALNRPDLPVVALDALRDQLGVGPDDQQGRVVQGAKEACRGYLRASVDFAFNATNTVQETRRRWIDLFADYQARVEIVYIEPPLDVLFRQNETRDAAANSASRSIRREPVPRRVIDRLIERLEPPMPVEAHRVTLVG